MEYASKSSKKEKPAIFLLEDLGMRVQKQGRDETIHYSNIDSILIYKGLSLFSIVIITKDRHQYTVSNRFVHDDGRVEDKSNAYALFVRVLHMHLREKSRAHLTCVKTYHLPDWQKYLWVPVAFALAFGFDRLGFSLFHWALQGIALAAIGLLIILVSEKNRSIEKTPEGEIPMEFLPQ
jgi:hypothetical protein